MTKNVGRCSELAEVILCVQVFEKLHTRHSSIVQYCKFKDSLLNNIYLHAILVFCTRWLSFCKLCNGVQASRHRAEKKLLGLYLGKQVKTGNATSTVICGITAEADGR